MKYLLYILFAFAISSCNQAKKEETKENSQAENAVINPEENPSALPVEERPAVSQNSQPTANDQTIQPQPQQLQPGQSATTASGMNPPHGEPGHRCDIAVGAPLNSPPGNQNQPMTTQPVQQPTTTTSPNIITPDNSPVQLEVAPAQPGQTSTPSVNPPHGEPGHRCDIAVGAPL